MDRLVLGVDLGSTVVKAGIVTEDGKVLEKDRDSTSTPDGLINFLDPMLAKNTQITGIGIGTPGPIDIERGQILGTPNLKEFTNFPIVKLLKDKFKLTVFFQRDANVALIGEVWKGAAVGQKNVIMLTLGTGIGGAILIDGKLYTGEHGWGAEIGHIIINPNGRICGCGKNGCLESEIGEKGILSKYGIGPQDLIVKVEEKDERYVEIARDLGKILGTGLASIVNIFDPAMIVLAGGQINLGEVYVNEAKMEMKKRTLVSDHPVKVVTTALADQAGIIGAAKMVFEGISD